MKLKHALITALKNHISSTKKKNVLGKYLLNPDKTAIFEQIAKNVS